jgi:predicted ATPase
MIKRLSVSNYRSLGENVTMEFGQFTALVGPNGSGKSNVVDVLRFVSDCMHMGLSGAITHRHGIGAVRRWSGGHPFNMAIALELALDGGVRAQYSFELKSDAAEEYRVTSEIASVSGESGHSFVIGEGAWLDGPEGLTPPLDEKSLALPIIGGDIRFQPLVQALQRISIHSIFPDTLRAPQKYNPAKPMDTHGSNWTSILKDQPRATWKPELVSALHKLTGDIEDIKVSQAASYLVVQFRHLSPRGRQKWFDAAQESDGTLRVAGIVTALLQEPPVPVIGIEEPELTVHPGALPLLFDFLKQASRRSQVLVTTHSPELLDQMEAEDVRVVLRGQKGTTVTPMSEFQRRAVREGLLTLGEVLRTEGVQPDLPLAGVG